jgi:hypothetical protein
MKLLLQGRQRLRYYPKLPCPSSQALDLNSEVKRKESGRWGPTGEFGLWKKRWRQAAIQRQKISSKYISSTYCDQFHLGIVTFHMEVLKSKGRATLYIYPVPFFSEVGFYAGLRSSRTNLNPGGPYHLVA